MQAKDMVQLYYLRQIRNVATGKQETPKEVAEGVRQDIATAHRSLESNSPNGAMKKALIDYPAGLGQVKSVAGVAV